MKYGSVRTFMFHFQKHIIAIIFVLAGHHFLAFFLNVAVGKVHL